MPNAIAAFAFTGKTAGNAGAGIRLAAITINLGSARGQSPLVRAYGMGTP